MDGLIMTLDYHKGSIVLRICCLQILLPMVSLFIFLGMPTTAHALCTTGGTAYGVTSFVGRPCGSGNGGGGGGYENDNDTIDQIGGTSYVVGTHHEIKIDQFRMVPSAGEEQFFIEQRQGGWTNGRTVRGYVSAADNEEYTTAYQGVWYSLHWLRAYLYAPGMDTVIRGSGCRVIWTPLKIGDPAFPDSDAYRFMLALRITHESACRLVYRNPQQLGLNCLPKINYELFAANINEDMYNSRGSARAKWSEDIDKFMSIGEEKFGVFNNFAAGASASSNVLMAEINNHKYYEIGCNNCLEGCSTVPGERSLCKAKCGHDGTKWSDAANNIIPNTNISLFRKMNYYGIESSSSSPDLTGCTHGVSSPLFTPPPNLKVCKGWIDNSPCDCIPTCAGCTSCEEKGVLAWPIPLRLDTDYRNYAPGPWVCTRAVLSVPSQAYVSAERMAELDLLGDTSQGQYPGVFDIVETANQYGSGCGIQMNFPHVEGDDDLWPIYRTGAALLSGYWMGWQCGGGILEIPADPIQSRRWYVTNSGDEGAIPGCWKAFVPGGEANSQSYPFYIERLSVYTIDANNMVTIYGKNLETTWARFENAPPPTPMAVATASHAPPPWNQVPDLTYFGMWAVNMTKRPLANYCTDPITPRQPQWCAH